MTVNFSVARRIKRKRLSPDPHKNQDFDPTALCDLGRLGYSGEGNGNSKGAT
jgi:hypothetical protein